GQHRASLGRPGLWRRAFLSPAAVRLATDRVARTCPQPWLGAPQDLTRTLSSPALVRADPIGERSHPGRSAFVSEGCIGREDLAGGPINDFQLRVGPLALWTRDPIVKAHSIRLSN